MKRCPACMAELGVTDRCMVCGLQTALIQEETDNVLPVGMVISSRYELGLPLAQNRQSICYIAWDRNTRQPVLAEEFFPRGACGRAGTEVKAQGRGERLFAGAAKMMFELPCPGNRSLPCIQSFMFGGTCFRIYSVSSGVAARQEAEKLLDQPVFFRDQVGKPLMSINALPIPALPKKRNLRVLKTSKKEEQAGGEEKINNPSRLFIIIGILIVVLICIIGALLIAFRLRR